MTEPTVFGKNQGKPVMSRFFCQELLFDYVTGVLPADRKKMVDEYLKTDEVCREDLANLQKAQRYCQKLAKIEPPDAWIERWRNLPPALAKRISNLELRLISRLWTSLPYLVAFMLVTVGIAVFKPWKTLMTKDVVVWSSTQPVSGTVNMHTPESQELVETAAPVEVSAAPAPVTAPVAEAKPPEAKPAEPVIKPPPAADSHQLMTDGRVTTKKAQKTADKEMKDEEESPNAAVATSVDSTEADAGAKPGVMKGELYHAYLDVDEFDRATDQIKEKIVALEGEKAREKELGWHRKKDESYFHFTLPESNLESLTEFLRTFGPVRISKEKHPVVMPQGTIRIILIVKDNSDNADETSP